MKAHESTPSEMFHFCSATCEEFGTITKSANNLQENLQCVRTFCHELCCVFKFLHGLVLLDNFGNDLRYYTHHWEKPPQCKH